MQFGDLAGNAAVKRQLARWWMPGIFPTRCCWRGRPAAAAARWRGRSPALPCARPQPHSALRGVCRLPQGRTPGYCPVRRRRQGSIGRYRAAAAAGGFRAAQ